MFSKRLAYAALLLFLMASPTLAAPSLSWVDNLDGTATLQIVPTGVGLIDAEITVTAANFDLISAILDDPATFDTINPGNNPITGTVTDGLWLDLDNNQLFASYGSVPLDSTDAVNFLTIGYGGFPSGALTAAGLVAEGGANFLGLSASVDFHTVIFVGDVNLDGFADGLDIAPFVDRIVTGTYQPEADLNRDSVVDALDIFLLVTYLTGGTKAVPEPSSLALACVMGAAFLCFRHQKTAS